MKVSVITPTYNEKDNVKIFIPRVEKEFFQANKLKGEIIVVDDSSPDGTADVARKLNKKYRNVRVIVKKKKEGIESELGIKFMK